MSFNADHFVLENGLSCFIYGQGTRPFPELDLNLSFVINVGSIVNSSSKTKLELSPGHELRKATPKEVLAIKNVLSSFMPNPDWPMWEGGEWRKEKGLRKFWLTTGDDQWRYFVIVFEGSNSTTLEIERALCISPFDLKLGFTILRSALGSTAVIYHPSRLFSQLRSLYDEKLPFVEVTSLAAESIRSLRNELRQCDESLVKIKRLSEQVLDLDALPHDSQLVFLGYFAILESLITHQPSPTDTIDSITRQVKQKIALLDNRWQPRIDYGAFQQGKTHDAIWSTMYAYRSCLAHGGEPDFSSKLKLLGDCDRALRLLKQTVKAVLRQAVAEPRLILDLRNC